MPNKAVDRWLHSGSEVEINGIGVMPKRHPVLKDTALTVQRGQAEVVFCEAADGSYPLLKRFHPGRELDRSYLNGVTMLLPDHAALYSGKKRTVLHEDSIGQRSGYHDPDLVAWLDGAIVMPRVSGDSWNTLAEDVREQVLDFDTPTRRCLATQLAELVAILEAHGCAHRDLSSGNVLIDLKSWYISLIDFDSVYHGTLSRPAVTMCGTAGYIPGFVWNSGEPDSVITWNRHADRFALALLVVEMLTLSPKAPTGSEGGLFTQDELRAGQGPGFGFARDELATDSPRVRDLFDQAVLGRSYRDCPSPTEWCRALRNGGSACTPVVSDLNAPPQGYFNGVLNGRRARRS